MTCLQPHSRPQAADSKRKGEGGLSPHQPATRCAARPGHVERARPRPLALFPARQELEGRSLGCSWDHVPIWAHALG